MKIAIISSNTHDKIGGTETYARNLISIFKHGHSITEYPIMNNGKVVSKLDPLVKIDKSLIGWGPDDLIWAGTYKKSALKKIYENNDVVILNNVFPPKRILKNEKTILLQHMDVKFYGFKGKPFWLGVGSFFSWLLFGVSGTIGNPFKTAKNVVFFDETTGCETDSRKFYIPLPSEQNDLEVVRREGFVWISRLDNPQKNVDDAIYISNNTDDLKIFGSGPYKKKLIKLLKNKDAYKGLLTNSGVKDKLSKSKALIVTSNWEGFPFTIVEALHAGTPVILYDKFKSVNYFKNSNLVHVARDRDEIIEMMSKDLLAGDKSFAQKNLSKEAFKRNWEKLLKEVTNE